MRQSRVLVLVLVGSWLGLSLGLGLAAWGLGLSSGSPVLCLHQFPAPSLPPESGKVVA